MPAQRHVCPWRGAPWRARGRGRRAASACARRVSQHHAGKKGSLMAIKALIPLWGTTSDKPGKR